MCIRDRYYTTHPKSPLALDSRPSSDTDVAWALRNWTAWNWLSGGPLVEQIVHTIDGMVWSMNEQLPLAAVFRERIDFGSNLLTEQYGSRVQLDKSRLFDGLDGYKKLLQTDIDAVSYTHLDVYKRQFTCCSLHVKPR